MIYPMLVLSSFGTYYLPTLSRMTDPSERIDLMRRVFRVTTIVMTPLLVMAIVINPLVVKILYTGAFLPSLDTVRWMLVADYLKGASWVLAMPILAFADMRVFFWTESLWYAGFIGFGVLSMVQADDIQVIGQGFLILYALYLAFVFYYSRSRHGFGLQRKASAYWFLGLGLIIAAVWQTWSYVEVNWPETVAWLLISFAFPFATLTARERHALRNMLLRRED
jgi:PST family polysaccharide transporter